MTTIAEMVARWESAERPLFRGSLIDENGCCCAQGDVLRVCGMSDAELRQIEQKEADRRVAKELGISLTHSILLRQVNDREDGCPQDALAHPERVLGDQTPKLLAFWHRLDAMTIMDWAAARAAGAAAGAAAWDAAWDAAWAAAGAAAGAAARDAARAAAWAAAKEAAGAAAWATNEIQGIARLEKFFFLPMFGIPDHAALEALQQAREALSKARGGS